MYRGFNLKVPEGSFSQYKSRGAELKERRQRVVEEKLKSFQGKDGSLCASEMTAEWFPEIDARVFISHAHRDNETATGFAGFLDGLGVSSFIDSAAWGYSDKLLRLIDNDYCYNESSKTYDYKKRNRSTAHVHMMLSVALTQMINHCECIIFLNTPNSISSSEYVGGDLTNSPWIYAEIAMTSLVQKRSKEAHRMEMALANESLEFDTELKVNYEVDLDQFKDLNGKSLDDWAMLVRRNRKSDPLDILYGF